MRKEQVELCVLEFLYMDKWKLFTFKLLQCTYLLYGL